MNKVTEMLYQSLKIECFKKGSRAFWIVAYPDGTSFKSESLEEVFADINNKINQ